MCSEPLTKQQLAWGELWPRPRAQFQKKSKGATLSDLAQMLDRKDPRS